MADTPPPVAPPAESLLQTVQGLWRELPGLINDRVDLLALELQRAGRALAQIVALVMAAAILGVTAWLALWGGVTAGLVALGLHWSLSVLVVLAVNVGAAWWAVSRVRGLLPLLQLPATRRHLMFSPPRNALAPQAVVPQAPQAVVPPPHEHHHAASAPVVH